MLTTLAIAIVAALMPQTQPHTGGMHFNPTARLDASQVQDRRAQPPVTITVEGGWTCVLDGAAEWHCMPPGMTV